MSDLENMSEALENDSQPVEVVATEAEETTQPQGGDVEELAFVEDEGEPIETPNDDQLTKQRAAFAKSKQKQREEKEKREAAEKEARELREEIERIKTQLKPAKPTLESCGFDEDEFEKKINEYYSTNNTVQAPKDNKPQPQVSIDEDSEFYLYQKADELRSQLKNYDDLESKAKAKLVQDGANADVAINEISFIARQTGADAARAIAAFGSSDVLYEKLKRAVVTGNQFAIAEVIKEAAAKIQPVQRKKIDTIPEPTINNSGPIDNKAAAVAKAREAWVNASPSEKLAKWNEYQAVKKT